MAGRGPTERYEMISLLGGGGMGSVWLARDTLLQRNVAVKHMRAGKPVSTARVLREARAFSRLSHPNIVRVIDLVETDDGPWIVMDYVEGRSLAEWIAERPTELTEARVAEIGVTVLDALKAAHDRGVIHGDVKPANILIENTAGPLSSRIRLVDFGSAAMEVTAREEVVGTLEYTAPERLRRTIETASDLWSLGVTLYEAVERRLPFQRETADQGIYAILHDDPNPMERARLLAPVLTRLLEKDPTRRPDPDQLRRTLRRVASAVPERRVAGAMINLADAPKTSEPHPGVMDPARDDEAALRFIADLVRLHRNAGMPSYSTLERNLLSRSTMSDVLTGKRMRVPEWRFVDAFVAACRAAAAENGLDPEDLGTPADWRRRWEAAVAGYGDTAYPGDRPARHRDGDATPAAIAPEESPPGPESVAPPPGRTRAGPTVSRPLWRAFTDGLGGTFDIRGGTRWPRRPPAAVAESLPERARALRVALGLGPDDTTSEGRGR